MDRPGLVSGAIPPPVVVVLLHGIKRDSWVEIQGAGSDSFPSRGERVPHQNNGVRQPAQQPSRRGPLRLSLTSSSAPARERLYALRHCLQ